METCQEVGAAPVVAVSWAAAWGYEEKEEGWEVVGWAGEEMEVMAG
jgi:hypothetical protein